jgi:SWI/SNF-related matrix-associated actin-dependent regulator of chromatin subfamily A3
MAPNRGCVTPQILGKIASYGVERVAGFLSLRAEDRERVHLALKRRRVDTTDLAESPSSSQPIPQPSQITSTQTPVPSTTKRKADSVPGPSRDRNMATPSPTQAAARQAAMGGAAWEEGADAEEFVEEQVDELYCTISSSVVGIQYYKGASCTISFREPVTLVCITGLVDAGEQVRLIREPQNKYDRWVMS